VRASMLPPMSVTDSRALVAVSGWWRKLLEEHRAFVIVVAIAAALRVVVMILYHPAILNWGDTTRYLRIDPAGFFGDPYSPAGYPAFLRAMRFIAANLIVTVAVQHLIGLIGGVFIYLTVRRVSTVPWLGLLPASIVFFSGDFIFLEHSILSETLFMTLVFASTYAAVRALDDRRPRLWLSVSSLCMIASALVRPITLEIPLVIGIWAFFAVGRDMRSRLLSAAAAILPGAVMLGVYLAVASSIGPYTGINEMTGWDLYSRVAPFADCSKFTPPKGTRQLCESTPPNVRNGPFYYSWVATSPGLRAFPLTPEGGVKPGEFARAAIEAQPLAYLKAVVKDMARYIDPSIGTERLYSGITYNFYQFNYKAPGLWEMQEREIKHKGYAGVTVSDPGVAELEAYQTIFHIDGLPVLIMAILAVLGIVLERGRRRSAVVLLTACAFLMYLLPVLTLSYDIRYGWPPLPLLAAAATLSGAGLLEGRVRRPGSSKSELLGSADNGSGQSTTSDAPLVVVT
jgi:hypothetical protein